MIVSHKSTFSTHLPNHKKFAKWHDGIARGGITAVWRALGLQTGIDPHRGSVGRRFRLLSRTAILIDGGTHYLSPLQLLAYVVLGSPELRGLRPDDWRALHDRAWRAGLTSEAPDGPVRLPPQRPRSPTPNPAPTDTPSPAIPPDEFSEFWRHRASPIAPPSSIANPISRFASSRRLKTAALYDLADREEIAFFAPSALPDRPDWLPAAMRWGLRGRTTHPSLVVPAWSLDGARTNLVARNLDHTPAPRPPGPPASRPLATSTQTASDAKHSLDAHPPTSSSPRARPIGFCGPLSALTSPSSVSTAALLPPSWQSASPLPPTPADASSSAPTATPPVTSTPRSSPPPSDSSAPTSPAFTAHSTTPTAPTTAISGRPGSSTSIVLPPTPHLSLHPPPTSPSPNPGPTSPLFPSPPCVDKAVSSPGPSAPR